MGLVSEWLLDNFVKEWGGRVQQANALIQVVTVTITSYFMAFLRLNMDKGTNKYGLVNEGLEDNLNQELRDYVHKADALIQDCNSHQALSRNFSD